MQRLPPIQQLQLHLKYMKIWIDVLSTDLVLAYTDHSYGQCRSMELVSLRHQGSVDTNPWFGQQPKTNKCQDIDFLSTGLCSFIDAAMSHLNCQRENGHAHGAILTCTHTVLLITSQKHIPGVGGFINMVQLTLILYSDNNIQPTNANYRFYILGTLILH